jgi:hypothetical protein
MTVEYIGEDPSGREATNLKGIRTYTRVFNFSTSTQTDDAWDVGSHANAPVIGSAFRDAWCISSQPRCVDGKLAWKITAQYSSERELNTNPTLEPALITWDSEQFQRPAVFDKNGNAIVNSAGDPFDPPNMMDDSRRVVTVEKQLAVVPSWILTYQDAVNSDTFSIDGISIGIGLAKMQRVSVSPVQSRNGTSFRTVHFTIHLQKSGWLLEPLDAGFRERNYEGELVNIVNPGDGEEPSAPVPLDGAGAALDNPSYTNNVFLSFSVYETKVFSSLPLT